MKNAKELMLEYTASSIRDPKKAAEIFVSCHVRNSLTVQGPRPDRRSFPIRARPVAENGKIKLLREALNSFEVV
jgi:hypothetical protein